MLDTSGSHIFFCLEAILSSPDNCASFIFCLPMFPFCLHCYHLNTFYLDCCLLPDSHPPDFSTATALPSLIWMTMSGWHSRWIPCIWDCKLSEGKKHHSYFFNSLRSPIRSFFLPSTYSFIHVFIPQILTMCLQCASTGLEIKQAWFLPPSQICCLVYTVK